jgi:hypothetical protein
MGAGQRKSEKSTLLLTVRYQTLIELETTMTISTYNRLRRN